MGVLEKLDYWLSLYATPSKNIYISYHRGIVFVLRWSGKSIVFMQNLTSSITFGRDLKDLSSRKYSIVANHD